MSNLESFREAYKNLDLLPLLEQKELNKFRVDYGNSTIEELVQLVEDSPSGDCKIIFTGHRGCGKSTLLAEFGRWCEPQYFIVFFSIADTIEMSDVNHINILFAIAIKLMYEAEKYQVQIPKPTKDTFFKWFTTQTRIEEKKLENDVSVDFDFFKIISGKLRADAVTRQEIKQEFERRVSELVAQIDQIAAVIQTSTRKDILVIIDDLDKLDLVKVNEIYRDNIKSLCLPHFRIIFTIPIAALRDKYLKPIIESETNDQIVVMPVIRLFNKGESRQSNKELVDEKATLCEILSRRISEDLLNINTAEKMALYSGGVVRELIRIANESCRICLRIIRRKSDNENLKINDVILEEAINNLRNDFATPLSRSDYEILRVVYKNYTPEDPNQTEFLQLLHGLHIIEYHDRRNWYDIHPILIELLRDRELI